MKKVFGLILAVFILLLGFPGEAIYAEDYSDTEYWDNYCAGYKSDAGNTERYQACTSYNAYKINNSKNTIGELQDHLNELKNDLAAAQKVLNEYIASIDQLQTEIDGLNVEIGELEVKIEELSKEIAAKEAEVEVLNNRVIDRMAAAQSTMHFNPYLDFLLGAQNFEDMLRRGYGLDAIMQSDEEMRDELKDTIDSLESDKATLNADKELLDAQKASVENKKQEIVVLKNFQAEIIEKTNAEIDATLSNLEEEYQNYSNLVNSSDFDGLPNDEGFIRPIPGASISAGVWHYPASFGGGIHLGVDYAVSKGTTIVAPATGVVIIAANGCGDGWLGNTCGYQYGGEIYGGNQLYLIVSAGGSIYGVIFCHLLLNSITVSEGDIVVQGQSIAKVGSSGNSTGPHSHVELFYLGEGDLADIPDYLNNNYTKSFNCGWGSTALRRLCENGVGAPCRLNPAAYL